MTPFNEHVRLAQAMLSGHLYIDNIPPQMEHINVAGHSYILHPPLSAIVSVPFVLCGITDPAIISACLGSVTILLVHKLTRSLWLTTFFVLGTTFVYEATKGASWDFALTASLPFTLLAILGIERDWPASAVGLTAGLAFLTRYDLILATPIYLAYLHRASKHTYMFVLGLLPSLAFYVWFNEMRFGTLTDISISEWYWHYDKFRSSVPYGPFSVRYIPLSLYTLLFMSPNFNWRFPWFRPQFMGQALLSLSPAFLMADLSLYTIAALLCSIPALTVYANGFSQLGCRYYVQVWPFLIASMNPHASGRTKVLIVVSVISSQYFTWVAWTYGL